MYQLKFTLKQHTPIIHFQYDQQGATLRATEVKPKLDRFIIEKVTGFKDQKAFEAMKVNPQWHNWLIANAEHPALNYKLTIIHQGDPVETEIENQYQDNRGKERVEKFPGFFALLGTVGKPDKAFSYCKNQELTLTTFIEPLKNFIETNIYDFFLTINFGTRQSKGFGSYTIANEKLSGSFRFRYKFNVNTHTINVRYNGTNSSELHLKWYKLFYAINLFYSTLKSGLNQYDKGNESFYFKSLLFLYTKNKLNAQWDKKAIKASLFPINFKRHQLLYPNADTLTYTSNQQYLMRDLLGLATESAWKAEYEDNIKKEHPEIERFKSPLFFKPIEVKEGIYEVFIQLNQEAINQMVNQTFTISNRQGSEFNLSTPPAFNIQEFIDFAISINIKQHIQFKKSANISEDSKLLERIYSDIKNYSK